MGTKINDKSFVYFILIVSVVGVLILLYNLNKDNSMKSGYTPTFIEQPSLPKVVIPPPIRQHPVLAYQRWASGDTVPASIGDAIRPNIMLPGPPPTNYNASGYVPNRPQTPGGYWRL